MANVLQVMIRAREGIKYEGEAVSISSINSKGTFDILPSHANFICAIEKKIWIHTVQGQRQEFNIGNGVLHVHENQVAVFLEIK